MPQTLEPAAGLSEGAVDEQGRAVVLEVRLQVLAGQQPRLAVVRAAHRHAPALGHVGGEGVGDELLTAVAAAHQPLGAVVGLVGTEVATLHLQPALVLAVQRLEPAAPHVSLKGVSGEVLAAELAACASLRAGVLEVVLHEHAGDLGAAAVAARRRVVLAHVQVGLQLPQLVAPLAAVLVMDAVHHRPHDGLLRVRLRVDDIRDGQLDGVLVDNLGTVG